MQLSEFQYFKTMNCILILLCTSFVIVTAGKIKEQTCNHKFKTFDSKNKICICLYPMKCSKGHIWNEEGCRCHKIFCSNSCPSGEVTDHNCQCVKEDICESWKKFDQNSSSCVCRSESAIKIINLLIKTFLNILQRKI